MNSARFTLPLLIAVACVQQYRCVSRAVLPAQDAVDFVSVAQRIDREGFLAAVRAEPVQPLFPAWVCAVHRAGGRLGVLAENQWGPAAQLAAAAAAVGCVVPVFLLARRLFGPDCGLLAGLLVCLLPEFARLGADGVSDSLHLMLVGWALWAAVAALDAEDEFADASLMWWLTGSLLGAALLVRAEAAAVVVALALWAAIRTVNRRRSTARVAPPEFPAAPLLLPLGGGLLLCVIPYVSAGLISPAEIAWRVRGGGAPTEDVPLNPAPTSAVAGPEQPLRDAAGEPLVFGHKDRTRSTRFHGFVATGGEFVREFGQAGGLVVLPFAVAGAWTLAKPTRRPAAVWLGAFVAVHLTFVFAFAWRGGYLSTRHLLGAVVGLLPYAALGMTTLAGIATTTVRARGVSARGVAGAFAALIAVGCVAVTARPLHESQLAHRRAIEWLDSPAAGPGRVLDQQGFTALESGRTTYRFDSAERALADRELAYVVVERADLEAESPRGRSLRTVLGEATAAAATFADPRRRPHRDVLVFARSQPLLNLQTAGRETLIHAR